MKVLPAEKRGISKLFLDVEDPESWLLGTKNNPVKEEVPPKKSGVKVETPDPSSDDGTLIQSVA